MHLSLPSLPGSARYLRLVYVSEEEGEKVRKILIVGEDVYLCEVNQIITKNGNYLSQIIAKNSNI